MLTILEDTRPIRSVHFNDENEGMYKVGECECTKIEAYGEPGEYCFKAWIAVYVNNIITTRFPASMVQIIYVT